MADIPRIKGNISKMIAQGAPEADIDAYVAGEGVTLPELNGVKTESGASDAFKSLDAGLAKGIGIIGGAPGDILDIGSKGVNAAANFVRRKVGSEEQPAWDRSKSMLSGIPTSKSMDEAIQRDYYDGAKPYEPQSKAGNILHKAGEFAPSMLVGPGGVVAKALATGGAAVGSEYGGDVAEGVIGPNARPYGEFAGGVVGGLSPAGMGRLVTPLPATAARQRLVDVLADEGVTSLTAGQRTGSKGLQYGESMLGDALGAGGGAANIQRQGQEQFTQAAMRRAGGGADAAPETLAANQDRLTGNFRDLSARNTLTPDNQFITDVTQAVRQYRNVPNSQQAQMIQGYIDDIVPYINAGAIPGPEYQAMRSRMSRQANRTRQSDPDLSEALRGFRNALDNAMERSIPAGSQDAALWQQTRREYGAQKDIEKAASRAGEATAEGQIVPTNLRNTVAANNRGAYARGEGDFSELSRAGAGVMAPLPNSGTAQRNLMTDIAKLPVAATVGRALMSRPVQGYLGNQLLARQLENLPPARQALLRALISTDRQKLLAGPDQ